MKKEHSENKGALINSTVKKSKNESAAVPDSTEKALKDALKNYQAILDEVEDCVGQVDLDGTITSTNRAGVKIWGVERKEDIIGLNFRTYMDKESAEFVYRAYNKIFQTGVPDKIAYDIIRKDGSCVSIEDSVAPIRNEKGLITGFRTVSRDVSERKKKERELEAHKSRLEAIFRSVKDAIITVDPDLRVIEANMNAETICRLNAAQMVGKMFPDCVTECSRACVDVLKQTLDKTRPSENTGSSATISASAISWRA